MAPKNEIAVLAVVLALSVMIACVSAGGKKKPVEAGDGGDGGSVTGGYVDLASNILNIGGNGAAGGDALQDSEKSQNRNSPLSGLLEQLTQ